VTELSEQTDELRRVTDELGPAVANLRRYGHTNRRLIYGLLLSLVFDVCLTVGVWHVADNAGRATSKANDAQLFERASCQAGNQSRALQIQLWTATLGPVQPGETAHQRQEAARFLALVRSTYQPRKC
jgi:hypothetical protein